VNKLIVAVVAAFALVGTAVAADTMTFDTKNGKVTFAHKAHQDKLKDCKACHEKGAGKIEGFGKDIAHKTCKGCHEEKKAGPTKCGECHKK
jgi:flavoprotein